MHDVSVLGSCHSASLQHVRFETSISLISASALERHTCGGVQTADKAVVEIFPEPASSSEVVAEVVRRAVSPASEIGGDARLIMPDERRIKAESAQIGSTVWASPWVPCSSGSCFVS